MKYYLKHVHHNEFHYMQKIAAFKIIQRSTSGKLIQWFNGRELPQFGTIENLVLEILCMC